MEYVAPKGTPANSPYVDYDPSQNQTGSVPVAAAIEHPMREIVSAIRRAGLVPDGNDLEQLADAMEKLANAVVPPGNVMWHAAPVVPAGWLLCNGFLLQRNTYQALFDAIGTQFNIGGENNTQFRVPDLRGVFIRGFDNGRGVDNGRGFGSYQADELKSHRHKSNVSPPNGGSDSVPLQANAGYSPQHDEINQWTTYTGGNETRPKNVALLPIIKY